MYRFIGIIIFLVWLGSLPAMAQVRSAMAFEKDTSGIGEQVELHILVELSGNTQIEAVYLDRLDSIYEVNALMQSLQDTLSGGVEPADVSIDDLGLWQDNDGNGIIEGNELKWAQNQAASVTQLSNTIKMTIWDVGEIFCSNLRLRIGGHLDYSPPNGAKIVVIPPASLTNSTDTLALAPIKPIIREGLHWRDFLPIALIALAILFIVALIYWLSRKKPTPEKAAPVTHRPAHEVALEALHTLEAKKLWQKGQIKAYQSELTHIIRVYLENRYRVPALESTTEEITTALESHDLGRETTQRLREILQIADLVKFAKAEPALDIHQRFLDHAREFVLQTTATSLSSDNPESRHD